MVANAMYYDTGSDYELPALFEVGPFRFTPKQVPIMKADALKTIFHVLFRLKIKINHINISIHVQKTKFHMRVYKLMTFLNIAVRNQIIGRFRVFPLSYLCGRGLVSLTSSRTSPIKSDHWIT